MQKRRLEWLISFPSLLWMFVFFLIPSIMIYAYAFKPTDVYGGVEKGWTLETLYNLSNLYYLRLLFRTLWLSLMTTALCLLLAIPVSYQMATIAEKKRNLILILIVIPFWSSLLIRIFAWKILLHPEGLFHTILVKLHLISSNTTLLYNPLAVLFVMVYTFLPFAILPIYTSALKFDFQLIEAALDLGATKTWAILSVFLPGIERGIVHAILMVFIPAVGTYVIPDLVGGIHSEMLGNKIAQKILVERNLPESAALAAVLTVVVTLILLIVKRYLGAERKVRIYEEVRNRE